MSKILVTGANGQLGSELRALVESNILLGMDPRIKSEDDESRHSRESGNLALSIYQFTFTDRNALDLSNLCKLEDYFDNHTFDIIINCAAYTVVDKAESDEELANTINNRAVSLLAKIAKKKNISLIHISTDYVFNGQNYRPYIETDLTDPQGVYGRTKRDGENAILEVSPKNCIIIRTSWVYSSFGNNFVKTMLRLGKERDSLGVIFDQVGTPTYARDLAQAILEVLPQVQNESPEIYHYSNEGVASWYDFAQAIFELSNISCEVNPITTDQYPTPATRPHYSLLNKNKIKEHFGISIPYWKKSIKECLEYLGEKV
jgi:dTDP-4-dehydrorhamnose reductase